MYIYYIERDIFQLYTKALEEDPTRTAVLTSRAHAYIKLEKYEGRTIFHYFS